MAVPRWYGMGCAMLHTQYSGLRSIIVCTIVCGMVLCNSFLLLPTAPSFVVTLTAFCLLPSACLFPDTRLIRVTTALLPFSFSFFFVLTTSLFASPHHHTTAAVDAERVLERYVCLPSALRPRRRLPPQHYCSFVQAPQIPPALTLIHLRRSLAFN